MIKQNSPTTKESVIGLKTECLIVDTYSQDGTVKAIPLSDEIRIMAGNEALDYALIEAKKRGFFIKPE